MLLEIDFIRVLEEFYRGNWKFFEESGAGDRQFMVQGWALCGSEFRVFSENTSIEGSTSTNIVTVGRLRLHEVRVVFYSSGVKPLSV